MPSRDETAAAGTAAARRSAPETEALSDNSTPTDWRLFPCRPDKSPATAHWPSDATADREQWRAWWRAGHRHFGLALPETLVVIDVDCRPTVDGRVALRALDLEVPTTCRVSTPSGGWHAYFAVDRPLDCRNGLYPGVDIKSAGGYVLIPPSPRYSWVVPFNPDYLMPAPEWLLELVPERRGARDWSSIAGATIGEGQRRPTLLAVAGALVHGLRDPRLAVDLALLWAQHRCSPPIPLEEVERIVQYVLRAEAKQLQRVASSIGRKAP